MSCVPPPPAEPDRNLDAAARWGRRTARSTYDYTSPDAGAAIFVQRMKKELTEEVPVLFPPRRLPADQARYDELVHLERGARRRALTWTVILGAPVAFAMWAPYRSLTALTLAAGALIAALVWVASLLNPAKVPVPPVLPDPRQDEVTRMWWRAGIAAGREEFERLIASSEDYSASDDRIGPPQGEHLTPWKAEAKAAEWLERLGARGVRVSQQTRDGGVDVHALGFAAQVKWQAAPVSPAPLHQIAGVAASLGVQPLFFTGPAGYSKAAVAFAEKATMAVFVLSTTGDELLPSSSAARLALDLGLPGFYREVSSS